MIIRDPGEFKGKINISPKLIIHGDISEELDFVDNSAVFIPKGWHIKWKNVTSIEIIVRIDYKLLIAPFFGSLTIGDGHYSFSNSWLVHYGDSGITLDPQLGVDLGSSPGAKGIVVAVGLAMIQSAHEADAAFVSLHVQMKGGYSDDGISFGLFGVGVSGVFASASAFSRDVPLKVFLFAKDRPSKEKQVEITDDLLSSSVYFEKNKHLIDRSSLGDLAGWIKSLQGKAPNLTKAIKDGKVTITLSGYASTEGSTKVNDNISKERIGSLEKEIKRKFDSEAIRIDAQPHGKRDAKQKGNVPAEMRVDIKLDRAEATKAVQGRGL
ncbi:hypothetical protein LJR090_004300 [Bosea sp. LjRoot90]|uniref:hypothetical protein n=1 Tax=Bosea sp. LjRoot90 TaxID=3342342 RepID=UPI003ED0166C